MSRYALSHLSDHALLRGLAAAVVGERAATADVLAHIAAVDARKLYLPAGYPSMFAHCLGELRLSEDAAYKRIQAARTARRFPAIFHAVADGRLHLTGLGLLVPYLVEDTASELLAAAAHKTKGEIEQLLAERFPKSDLLAWVATVPGPVPATPPCPLAPAQVGTTPAPVPERLGRPPQPAPAQMDTHPRVTPLSHQSYALQVTMDRRTHDKLRHAQELLGHQIPSGDLAEVLDRVLDLAIAQLEKQKLGSSAPRRRNGGRTSTDPRHIPLPVRRAVWKRDGGRCTFVSESGHRCEARRPLEFDHIEAVARGGESSVANLRLRCRAHNQFETERTFGADFMRHKRIAAAEARVGRELAPS